MQFKCKYLSRVFVCGFISTAEKLSCTNDCIMCIKHEQKRPYISFPNEVILNCITLNGVCSLLNFLLTQPRWFCFKRRSTYDVR
jgi:hypothetical protein